MFASESSPGVQGVRLGGGEEGRKLGRAGVEG